jgi:branched-chain amino acid transport system substrate-binding protein
VGATVVYQGQVSLAQPDFTAECLQAQRNGAEAILAGLDSASISRLARACLQQGYRPGFYTGGLATTAATAEDPNLDGLVASLQTFPFVADDLPGAREQRSAVERFAPKMAMSTTTAAVWVAGTLLREVSQQLPAEVSPADFVNALHQVRNNTLGGLAPPLTYTAGQPAAEPRCFFMAIVKDRQYTAPNGSKQDCI